MRAFDSESARAASKTERLSFAQKFAAKPTRKAAIDLMCQRCMGGPEEPGWREEIRRCTATPGSNCPCPLWTFRPYQ